MQINELWFLNLMDQFSLGKVFFKFNSLTVLHVNMYLSQ
jgi:hypothetical protein